MSDWLTICDLCVCDYICAYGVLITVITRGDDDNQGRDKENEEMMAFHNDFFVVLQGKMHVFPRKTERGK